jgi:molybdopterin converting factor small subunit
MKYLNLIFSAVILVGFVILESCSSGKKAYYSGNYYEAVITSTNRLRRDPNNKKSIETLRQAYPEAVKYYDDRAKAAIASNAEFKWTAVVEAYTTINVMYDEIRRSPGALKVISNPVNYFSQLDEAKRNAAEEKYAAGVAALAQGNRDKAKQAYYYFREAESFVPGYKDVLNMKEAALWAATVKVLMEPIPVQARNISVSAEFFDNKVSEYLHSTSINEFVRFYTRKEADNLKLNPDHIIQIEFDEFAVGQVFLQEKESILERDSIVVGTYVTPTSVTSGNLQPNAPVTGSGSTDKPSTDKPVTNPASPPSGGTPSTNPLDKPTEGNPSTGGSDKPADPKSTTKDDGPAETKTPSADSGNTSNPSDTKKDPDPISDDFPSDTIDEKEQVTICHVPPGNESNRHTLVVSKSALAAHLAHGDVLGSCEDAKEKGKPANPKEKDPKTNEKKPSNTPAKGNNGNGGMAFLNSYPTMLLASANQTDLNWLSYLDLIQYETDTVKIYGTAKATYYHYRKTTTSKGILNFKIIDARTQAVLRTEKMPGEYVWVSEWATFNGDERALTPEQLQISKQKEMVPPPSQELFIGFTQPIFNQLINRISEYYKGY